MLFQVPTWLQQLEHSNKKTCIEILRSRGLKKTHANRGALEYYIKKNLRWIYDIPWRQEQEQAIESFFQEGYNELVIQAVFGSGKTTIMLAIIKNLLFRNYADPSEIFIMAFNVAIKNEIKRKLHNPALKIKTYDSLVYTLCAELGMDDLRLPNFDGKRRFVRERLRDIAPADKISYVFVDETQDLETTCYQVLRRRFPNARFLFIGDIFQSIQKEPRESMLWHLLQKQRESRKVITMKNTPRVPEKILREISTALLQFYPEFRSTISQWSSSNTVSQANISWHSFSSYKDVFQDLLEFCNKHEAKDVMILTFSSAITVRGSLGDVARVRKFLNTNGIVTNANHKNMLEDRVFLSTANSSKGLERKHVFCFLTFPLEKAFSNFSDDLVVNIITVALSRAKDSIDIYIPKHRDRFSSVLHLYDHCPKPVAAEGVTVLNKKPAPLHGQNPFHLDIYHMRAMLEQEHGVTELLRQNILSFETRRVLKSFAKRYEVTTITPVRSDDFRNEEGCAFMGILFETLILSTWTKKWSTGACTDNSVMQHDMYSNFLPKIQELRKQYNAFIKTNGFAHQKVVFMGCVLYAKLHLACYQKLFVNVSAKQEKKLFKDWLALYPKIKELRPKCSLEKLKTQSNVTMSFVTGIADALVMNDVLEVIEIKASRCPEWAEHAFIQAILYGIMLGKSYFKIHLLNVSSKEAVSYAISFKGKLMEMRDLVQQEVAVWNLNCFLAKNVTHNSATKTKKINVDSMYILDGRPKEDRYTLLEMLSPTKTYILANNVNKKTVEAEIKKRDARNILLGRFIEDDGFHGLQLRFSKNHFRLPTHKLWRQFLTQIGYDLENSKMNWHEPLSTLSVQLCRMAQLYNF